MCDVGFSQLAARLKVEIDGVTNELLGKVAERSLGRRDTCEKGYEMPSKSSFLALAMSSCR